MAKQVSKYEAQDGTQFDTEAGADAHDQSLLNSNTIEAFMEANGIHKAQAGLMRKAIPAYLAFAASAEAPALAAAYAERVIAAEAAAEAAKAAEKAAAKQAAADKAEAGVPA